MRGRLGVTNIYQLLDDGIQMQLEPGCRNPKHSWLCQFGRGLDVMLLLYAV